MIAREPNAATAIPINAINGRLFTIIPVIGVSLYVFTNVTLLSFSPTKLLFPSFADDTSSVSFPCVPLTVVTPFSTTVIVGVYPSPATPFCFICQVTCCLFLYD